MKFIVNSIQVCMIISWNIDFLWKTIDNKTWARMNKIDWMSLQTFSLLLFQCQVLSILKFVPRNSGKTMHTFKAQQLCFFSILFWYFKACFMSIFVQATYCWNLRENEKFHGYLKLFLSVFAATWAITKFHFYHRVFYKNKMLVVFIAHTKFQVL